MSRTSFPLDRTNPGSVISVRTSWIDKIWRPTFLSLRLFFVHIDVIIFEKWSVANCRSYHRDTWTRDEMDFVSTTELTLSSRLLICLADPDSFFCAISFESYVLSCHLVFDVSRPISTSWKDQSCGHFRIRFIESRSRRNVLTRFACHIHLEFSHRVAILSSTPLMFQL